jgi:hypothetical protein
MWIEQKVVFTGSIIDLRAIYHADFDFQTLYPCPYLDALGEPIDDRCYAWCLEHWGTTNSARIIDIIYDEENCILTCCFMTESPPIGLFVYLNKLYPLLAITRH